MGTVNVTAIIVTRGDQNVGEILEELPNEWERIVWDNGFHGYPHADVYMNGDDWRPDGVPGEVRDLQVYGRYEAVRYAKHDLIYVQDDDCIVSDPQALVDQWLESEAIIQAEHSPDPWGFVVCNQPAAFRHGFYEEHSLVGFGAVFHRSLPAITWGKLTAALGDAGFPFNWAYESSFLRTCDVAFTALNPRVLVDIPYENLPWAENADRMYRQPGHQGERGQMLELAFRAKDAAENE